MEPEEMQRTGSRRRAVMAGSTAFLAASMLALFFGLSAVTVGVMVVAGQNQDPFLEWLGTMMGLAVGPLIILIGSLGWIQLRRMAGGRGSLKALREDGLAGLAPFGLAAVGPLLFFALLAGGGGGIPDLVWTADASVALSGVAVVAVLIVLRMRGGAGARPYASTLVLDALGAVAILVLLRWTAQAHSLRTPLAVLGFLLILAFFRLYLWHRFQWIWAVRPMMQARYEVCLRRAEYVPFRDVIRVIALIEADRVDEAEEGGKALLETARGRYRSTVLGLMAMVHRRRGDDARAEELVEEAIEESPEATPVWVLAELHIERGEVARALELIETAETLYGGGGWEAALTGSAAGAGLSATRAWALAVHGDDRTSRALCEELRAKAETLAAHPAALVLRFLGMAYEALGDAQAAEAVRGRAVALDPEGRVGALVREGR